MRLPYGTSYLPRSPEELEEGEEYFGGSASPVPSAPIPAPAVPPAQEAPGLVARVRQRILGDAELARAQRDDSVGDAFSGVMDGAFFGITGRQRSTAPKSRNAEQLLQRRGAEAHAEDREAKQASAAKKAALDDPNSEESRTAREMFLATDDGRAFAKEMGHFYDRLPASQIPGAEYLITAGQRRRTAAEKAAADAAALKTAEERRLQEREWRQGDETDRRRWEEGRDSRQNAAAMERARIAASAAGERRTDAAALKSGEKMDKQAQDLSKALEGLPAIRNDLAILQKAAEGDSVPGIGKLEGYVPNFLADNDAVKVRQATRGVIGALIKKRSGTAASDAEVARIREELGISDNATEQEFRLGLSRLLQQVQDEFRTTEAGFTPEAIKRVRERGGVTSQDLPSAQQAPSKDAAALKWARENPSDPRAAQILKRLGVTQ